MSENAVFGQKTSFFAQKRVKKMKNTKKVKKQPFFNLFLLGDQFHPPAENPSP